ncbi:cytidylyltransferase domain-containing protein [Mycetocola sp.]|uniref:cytidylyltransferase domain-containing protein n=1 Tax=Mycetocola sp. TaxID=1871042 RepID=UPI003989F1DF
MSQASPNLVVAVIPARGGSRGVPGKNIRRVGGVPLVGRAVLSARNATLIDSVFVSTDAADIADVASAHGANVIDRPEDLAGDTASSESALLHALDELEKDGIHADILVFLQATSPFISSEDLDDAIERVALGESDVVFSAVQTHAFLWHDTPAGAVALNHEAQSRPRRQDMVPQYRETGAFYVLRVAGFREARHRFFGRIGMGLVDPATAIDIDVESDLSAATRMQADVRPVKRIDVDAVVTDFDGVHTDNRVSVAEDGSETVIAHRGDGMGIALLRAAGIPVLILSTETNPVVAARARKLRVDVQHGVSDKASALRDWAASVDIPLTRIAYLGNDVNDLGCLDIVGWPVVVADAHPDVFASARLVLTRNGGDGAVRELTDLILNERTASHDPAHRSQSHRLTFPRVRDRRDRPQPQR